MSRKYRPGSDPEPEPEPVRTTVTLPEPLYLHLKAVATRRRCALYKVVTEALGEWLPEHYEADGSAV